MELIKFAARRSKWSDVVYIMLNIAYAVALFVLVSPGIDLPYLAFVLVFMSKWRIIAVRPRFWFANLQANFADFMVGISVVTLMLLTAAATMLATFPNLGLTWDDLVLPAEQLATLRQLVAQVDARARRSALGDDVADRPRQRGGAQPRAAGRHDLRAHAAGARRGSPARLDAGVTQDKRR